MSEAQAIELEPVIDVQEVEESEALETSEGIEIPVEIGDEPSLKKVSRFETRLRNKNNQINEAQTATEQVQRELEATREELKLYQMQGQQKANKAPNEDDFDDDRDYRAAKNAFDDDRIAEIAGKKAREIVENNQRQANQASQVRQQEDTIGNHYKRADALNVKNYDELEGNAMSILGNEFVQTIIDNTDNSELLLASIGANPKRANEILALSKTSPAKAFAQAVSFPINKNLAGATLRNTPSPETKLKPGESTQLNGWALKLDKARDQAAVSGDFSYIAKVKQAARDAGVTL